MTITGNFFSYTPHTIDSSIPDTLQNLNHGFTGILNEHRAGLRALLNGQLMVFGFKAVSEALPTILLTRGTVITPEGLLVEYPPGELEYIPHPGLTNYIYLASNYTVDIATSLPPDARMLFATCAPDEADETMLKFDFEVLVETISYAADGLLSTIELKNGERILASQHLVYDEQRRLILLLETHEGEFKVKEYAYDAQGRLTRTGVSFVQGLSTVLGDSLFIGIGETAVTGFD